MSLDAAVEEFLLAAPDEGSADVSVLDRRRSILLASDSLFASFGEAAGAVGSVADHLVQHASGAFRVRVYRPGDGGNLPIHVFIHGGAFWLGSIDERVVDATCRERCMGANAVVVAVDYRLAPEHRYPAPFEDCYQAVVWAAHHADEIGGDATRLTVGGVSAGANLAAAVTLAARDRGGPELAMQLLEVPTLDLTLDQMRLSGVGDGFGITVEGMREAVGLYLEPARSAREPYVSPLLAPDLTGLARAHIMTAEFDPLRRDGELYADRLRAAGISVHHQNYPGAIHGSLALTARWPPARAWRSDVIDALRSV